MNLYDAATVRRWRPDGAYDQHLPEFSPPRIKVVLQRTAADLEAVVNDFLAQPDLHILAVGPAVPRDGSIAYAITALYQERLRRAGEADDEEAGNA